MSIPDSQTFSLLVRATFAPCTVLKREKAWKICDSAFVFTTTQGAKVHVISWAGPGIKARDIPTLNLGSPQ